MTDQESAGQWRLSQENDGATTRAAAVAQAIVAELVLPPAIGDRLATLLARHLPDDDHLTVNQTATILGCDRDTVIRLIDTGRLPALNVGIRTERSFRIRR